MKPPAKKHRITKDVALNRPREGRLFTAGELKQEVSAALFKLGRERASQWLRFIAALHRPADDAKALQVLILAFRVNVASRQVHEYRICRS